MLYRWLVSLGLLVLLASEAAAARPRVVFTDDRDYSVNAYYQGRRQFRTGLGVALGGLVVAGTTFGLSQYAESVGDDQGHVILFVASFAATGAAIGGTFGANGGSIRAVSGASGLVGAMPTHKAALGMACAGVFVTAPFWLVYGGNEAGIAVSVLGTTCALAMPAAQLGEIRLRLRSVYPEVYYTATGFGVGARF